MGVRARTIAVGAAVTGVIAASGCAVSPSPTPESINGAAAVVTSSGEPGQKLVPSHSPITKSAPPEPRLDASPVVAALPATQAYRPSDNEPTPKFKLAAAHYLEVLLAYGEGEEGVAAARERLRKAGLPEAPAAKAKRLVALTGPAAVQVVYPQSGGQTDNAGSVMASVLQYRLENGKMVRSSRTIDIRLTLVRGSWRVNDIASDGGVAPPKPDMEAGAQVLGSDRIFFTDSARWDAQAGIMDSRVFTFLKDFSRNHTFKVSVFKTGHPYYVFAKKAVSYHSRGRAFDIWEIDGTTVVDWGKRPTKGNPAHELMQRALQLGSNEVGGPWAFSTRNGSTFTNVTHEDHLHIGFKFT